MKTIHWFGDSWCAGVIGQPFAELTSTHLNFNYLNYGEHGSNLDQMLTKFQNNINNIQFNDVVVFCLTTCYRLTWVDENNLEVYPKLIDNPTAKWKSYATEFANDYYMSHQANKVLNTLYLLCKIQGIRCFFVNAFYVLKHNKNLIIPDDIWLLPADSCLAEKILEIIGPEVEVGDTPRFTNKQWSLQKEKLDQYFTADGHPNQLGNKILAEILAEKLKYKLHT